MMGNASQDYGFMMVYSTINFAAGSILCMFAQTALKLRNEDSGDMVGVCIALFLCDIGGFEVNDNRFLRVTDDDPLRGGVG